MVDASGNYITTGGQEGLLLNNGGTIGNKNFNITAAHAVCRVMGFEGALQWTYGRKWQIQSGFPFVLDGVSCFLPEWSSCSYSGRLGTHNNHGTDVFLTCTGSRSPFSLVDKRGHTVSGDFCIRIVFEGL